MSEYDARSAVLNNHVCRCGQCGGRDLVSITERVIGISERCILPESIIDSESVTKLLDGVEFTAACVQCESFTEHLTEAVAAGWRAFEFDDGAGWNFLGWCPGCTEGESA